MDSIATLILILVALILLFILWKIIKPYIIKYDTTIFVTGELGSGKTLTCVKIAITQIRKARLKVAFYNKFILKFKNHFIKKKNKKLIKKGLEPLPLLEKKRKPQLISNIPIHFKSRFFHKDREWSVKLQKEMIVLLTKIPEYSIVLIDELPQLVNQFNWDIEEVKNNINEFITFFRHYYAGKLLITAQATNDVVVQIRRKCNQAIWCYNLKKHLFGLFYTINIADMILNDNIQNMSTTYIEDNTKKHYGLFPKKGTYDTRCFSERINNALNNPKRWERWKTLKTNEIIRMEKYISPLDDETTEEYKRKVEDKINKL